ncbi:MAG: cytochrome c peroxidase [Alphaproteobacteria bacterium]
MQGVLAAAVVMIAVVQPAAAHIQAEAPWHAIAYAYRNTLFMLNLDPVDWGLIERMLTTDDGGRILGRPASDRLIELDQTAGTAHWQAIETALMAENAAALHAATTRALSSAIRQHLANAAAALEQPGLAGAEIDQAQALYRALADGIRETDPEGFRALGLAWLELASSVRQSGVIGDDGLPADREAFSSARALLASYLSQNFEPAAFAPRGRYEPIPEQRFLADPFAKMAPWLPPGSDINDQDPLPRLVLNFEEQGIDERDVFLVAFGDMLFDSPEIFGDPAKSLGLACSTCHNRSDANQRFYIGGISPHPGAIDVDGSFFNARFNDHRSDPLDIPSLRGLRFTAPYGRDGRFASLRDFTRNVIVNEFKGPEPSPLILDALIAYMLEFDFLPAPHLERDGRLKVTASEAAKRGEVLFTKAFPSMNGQSCASCHSPGSHFTDNHVHDIGSAGTGAASGFSGAFDTPTLLGTLHTAPYFHDGRFSTLAEVVAWKDETFGLGLDEAEKSDLTAYLQAVGEGADPYQIFDEEATPFRLMVEELSVFLSTLDTLIPERDREHADLLLRTVAGDMELDASAMSNRDARDKTLTLAERLWQLRDMVLREAWDEAVVAWKDYQEMADAYDSELR